MATSVTLRHPATGLTKTGFVGYSWTTFFFGPFVPLFRLDFLTFLGFITIFVVLAWMTFGIGSIIAAFVWSFLYNRYYTRRLIQQGYVLADDPMINAMAARRLGVA